MKSLNKENTYLKGFEDHSRFQYMFVSKAKWVSWVVLFLMAGVTMMALALPVQIVGGMIAAIQMMQSGGGDMAQIVSNPVFIFILYTASTGATILAFFILVRFIEKRPFHTIGLKDKKWFTKYLKGAVIGIAMQLTYLSVLFLTGKVTLVTEPVEGVGTSVLGLVGLFLVMFIVQGASEEVVVRGWLMPVLSKHYKVPTAVILSSMFFGFMHLANPNVAVIPMINLILYGIFAALYAIYDDGLWGVFANHSMWNWFMGNVLGFPVSGMVLGGVSLFRFERTGATFITGGDFGPEGSVIVTGILLGASLLACFGVLKKKRGIGDLR